MNEVNKKRNNSKVGTVNGFEQVLVYVYVAFVGDTGTACNDQINFIDSKLSTERKSRVHTFIFLIYYL